MKHIYTIVGLCIGLSAISTETMAQQEKKILHSYSYGDLYNGTHNTSTVTGAKHYFYAADGRLMRSVESDVYLGDAVETAEKEEAGQEIPRVYYTYIYNEAGLLTEVTARKYGVYDVYDRAWEAASTVEEYTYTPEGKVSTKTDQSSTYTYTWDGDNCVRLTVRSKSTGKVSYTATYSDFVEGKVNLPQTELYGSAYQYASKKYKHEYDAAGHRVKTTEYKVVEDASLVKDEEMAILEYTEGNVYAQQEWTYDAEGDLTLVLKSYASADGFTPSTKSEYEKQDDGGILYTGYSYSNGKWVYYGSSKKEYYGTPDAELAPVAVSLVASDSQPNTLAVSAEVPQTADVSAWKIYRNGMLLAEVPATAGQVAYTDAWVHNGDWEYYVQGADGSISDVLTASFATELALPVNIRVVANGKNTAGKYEVRLVWERPDTQLEILGYNVYSGYAKTSTNPSPVNGQTLVTATNYTLTWDSSSETAQYYNVEAVYRIGKARSETFDVTLSSAPIVVVKDTRRLEHITYSLGDAMGTGNAESPSSYRENFYDKDYRLTRSIQYQCSSAGSDPEPYYYYKYVYDVAGNLVETSYRQRGVYDGNELAWGDVRVTETNEYDTDSHLVRKSSYDGSVIDYTYDGDHLVGETKYIGDKWSYTLAYSDFLEGFDNLPQRALKDGTYTSSQRIIEYTYDDGGRMTSATTYKLGEMSRDENNVLLDAEKGTPDLYETWTYNDEGTLTQYVKQRWNTTDEAWRNYLRTEYTISGDTITKNSFSCSIVKGEEKWTVASGTDSRTIMGEYDGVAPLNTTVAIVSGEVNTVRVSADAPAADEGTLWNVFRNGVVVGQAELSGGKLIYTDAMVPNGDYDYFIQAAATEEKPVANISTAVAKSFSYEFPVVENLRIVSNAMRELTPAEIAQLGDPGDSDAVIPTGKYLLSVEWDAPEANLPILGYNIYVDINPDLDNPMFDNPSIIEECAYSFSWYNDTNPQKTLTVETVFPIGKSRSEAFPVTLSTTPVGIEKVENHGGISISDGSVSFGSVPSDVQVCNAAGQVVARYSQVLTAPLSGLEKGCYVLKISNSCGVKTLKLLRK